MVRFSTMCLAIALVLLVPGGVDAQPKQTLLDTEYLRDHAQTRGFMLGRPVKPQPAPDGKTVLFLRSGPRSGTLSLFEFDLATKKTRELLSPEKVLKGAEEKLSPEEKARRERMRLSGAGFTSFQFSGDGSLVLLPLSGRLFLLDRATQQVRELPTGPGSLIDPKFSPDGTKISYVRDHDLHVFDLQAQKEHGLTKGGTAEVSHGLAEFVAQEEMDRFTGYWWSPESTHILFQESDARDVEVWHVADPIHPGQTPTPFFYPRPGKNNVKVRLGLISVNGGGVGWLKWDREKYPYLTTVSWTRGGPPLVCVQSRDQKHAAILKADPKTGATEVLCTDEEATWVSLHANVPRWLPHLSGFLWVTERNGGPQLELRNANGRLRRVIVPASEGFQGLVSVVANEKTNEVVYNASLDATQSQLFRRGIAEWSEPVKLSMETGLHAGVFTADHGVYVITSRTLGAMPQSSVHRADGTVASVLPSVAEQEPFDPRVELLQVVPGKEFHAAVIVPRKFEPRKKYPVMVDVYGGPHHVHVLAAKNRWLLDQWYADQGFIVVAIDGRGTPGRGRDWERAIYQKFGSLPLEDQVAALQALGSKHPAMDLDRVGVSGWSFGGYMSALAVMRRPDIFKAGVAGAPVCDWYDYDTHYTERYLGVPPQAGAAYKEGSLLTYAPELTRPLMVLHGTADDNVYFRHSLKLVDSLFRHGKDFEMVPLSGLTHMVPDPLVMERLHSRIAGFLRKHLGEPK